MELENDTLRIFFSDAVPIIKKYEFKPSNRLFSGHYDKNSLRINQITEPWSKYEIESVKLNKSIIYTCLHRNLSFIITFAFTLVKNELLLTLSVEDPSSYVSHISFSDYPFILVSVPQAKLTRQYWLRKPYWSKYGRWMFKYLTTKTRLLWTASDLKHPRFMINGCVSIPKEVCIAIYSNFRVKPIFIRVKRRSIRKQIEMGAYQYSPIIRGKKQPPLEVKIAFLQDFNDDGRINESDYNFWLNKQLPRNFQNQHKERMWYKIFCANPKVGVATTFEQVREIVKSIYNLTNGFPQTVFIVGWQMNPKTGRKGHDIDYPRLKHLNSDLGTKSDYRNLFEEMIKYNAIMSCHINIDDAYKTSTGWDESIMCKEKDGSLFRWEKYNNEQSYHVNHTKDVESRKIFERLDEFFESFPVKKMIHIDAMRNSNLNWEEGDFITAIDELYAGLIPIYNYLKEKGIEVSMEGLDFHPTEYAGLVSGTWHHKIDRNQVYFGNLVGGGFHKLTEYNAGLAWNIHQDIWWERFQDWDQIRDEIYTSILSRYLLQYEMKSTRFLPFHIGYDILFSEGVRTSVRFNNLEITKNGYNIVKNGVYMIPFLEKIYIYSKMSGQFEIQLPPEWYKLDFKVFELSKTGKKEINEYFFDSGLITVNLQSRCPLLIKKE